MRCLHNNNNNNTNEKLLKNIKSSIDRRIKGAECLRIGGFALLSSPRNANQVWKRTKRNETKMALYLII